MGKDYRKQYQTVMRKRDTEDEEREQRILDQIALQGRIPIPRPGGAHKVKAKDRKRSRRADRKSMRDVARDYNRGTRGDSDD